MIPAHFPQMVWAEMRCVYGRGSGKVALVVAVLAGIAVVVAGWYFQGLSAEMEQGGMPVGSAVDLSMRGVLSLALFLRNFFVLPMLLILATGAAFAAERGDNTLREVFVRPVPRWSVIAAKVMALMSLSAASLVCTALPAALGGGLLFGFGPNADAIVLSSDYTPFDVLLGYLASGASDLGLIFLVILASAFSARVAGVVVGVICFLMFDAGARALLGLMNTFGVDWAGPVGRMMPGSALAAWEGYKSGWEWEPVLGLAGLITVCASISLWRFQRMDVP